MSILTSFPMLKEAGSRREELAVAVAQPLPAPAFTGFGAVNALDAFVFCCPQAKSFATDILQVKRLS